MGKWIYEPVDPAALRRCELRIFPSTRLDAELFAAEHRRYVICVEARRIHDRLSTEALVRCGELDTSIRSVRTDDRSADEHRHVVVSAESRQRVDQRLCFDDAGIRRPHGCRRMYVRFLTPHEIPIHDRQRGAVRFAARAQDLERRNLTFVCGDEQLSAPLMRDGMALAKGVQPRPSVE